MTESGYYDGNVNTDEILSLLEYWDVEYFMDARSLFHMIGYYILKSQIHGPDTPTHM